MVDQLAIDVAAQQTAADVDQRGRNCAPVLPDPNGLQGVPCGHDADILALHNAGPFTTVGDLSNLQVSPVRH